MVLGTVSAGKLGRVSAYQVGLLRITQYFCLRQYFAIQKVLPMAVLHSNLQVCLNEEDLVTFGILIFVIIRRT
jgi:hypothetical protein